MDAMDFGKKVVNLFIFIGQYTKVYVFTCLVYILTKIVLVTGMGFAPQRGMGYGV
jgi:hypothetical protein